MLSFLSFCPYSDDCSSATTSDPSTKKKGLNPSASATSDKGQAEIKNFFAKCKKTLKFVFYHSSTVMNLAIISLIDCRCFNFSPAVCVACIVVPIFLILFCCLFFLLLIILWLCCCKKICWHTYDPRDRGKEMKLFGVCLLFVFLSLLSPSQFTFIPPPSCMATRTL